MSSILIAEDHAEIASFVDKGLRAGGYRTTITPTDARRGRWPRPMPSTCSSSTSACPGSTASRCSGGCVVTVWTSR